MQDEQMQRDLLASFFAPPLNEDMAPAPAADMRAGRANSAGPAMTASL
jgi:hypothetical protein